MILGLPMVQAACGLYHSALLSQDFQVFTFGCGGNSRYIIALISSPPIVLFVVCLIFFLSK